MNSFIQEYGRTIVAVIVVLAFIVFASVFGDTITGGINDITSDFFVKSGATSEENSETQTGIDTVMWDGNEEGRVIVGNRMHGYVKISNSLPTVSDLADNVTTVGVTTVLGQTKKTTTQLEDNWIIGDGYIVHDGEGVIVVSKENAEFNSLVFPQKGVYTLMFWGGYIESVKIDGYANL